MKFETKSKKAFKEFRQILKTKIYRDFYLVKWKKNKIIKFLFIFSQQFKVNKNKKTDFSCLFSSFFCSFLKP